MARWWREVNYINTLQKYLNFLVIGHEITDIKDDSIKSTNKKQWWQTEYGHFKEYLILLIAQENWKCLELLSSYIKEIQ